MELNEQEQKAISEFVSENWNKFKSVASNYLSEQDIEELGDRLAKE